MRTGKEQHGAVNRSYPAHDAVGSSPDFLQRFPSGKTVDEWLPAWLLHLNVRAAETFVLAVVPLDQVGIDLRFCPEAGQFTRPPRTLKRAGQHAGEFQPCQPFAETEGVAFAALRQREVGTTGMLTGHGPGCLTVPGQVDDGKFAQESVSNYRVREWDVTANPIVSECLFL